MESSSIIIHPIAQELEEFKKLYAACLYSSDALLGRVIAHLRRKQGKMMRPILVLLIAKLYGSIMPSTLHAAVALELLHTASLVHDDVVDESSERRGQLSVNAAFNNKVAVLSGDYFLATTLLQVSMTRHYDIIDLVAHLGQDLSEGELIQLNNVQGSDFSESTYFDVIRKKTAALFAACAKAGALSVDAEAEQVEYARLLGEYIGICFQIRDDIFDYYDSSPIGKPTGNDMLEGKLTLPALYAVRANDAEAKHLAMRVKQRLVSPDAIARLMELTKQSGGIDYATRIMNEYRNRAHTLLADLPQNEVRAALDAYVDYVVDRVK